MNSFVFETRSWANNISEDVEWDVPCADEDLTKCELFPLVAQKAKVTKWVIRDNQEVDQKNKATKWLVRDNQAFYPPGISATY